MAKHKLALEICGYKCKDKGEHCHLNCKTYYCLVKMEQWKNEQIAEEKQQLIDKAADWLRMTMDFFNNGEFNTEKFVNDFKKEMKGEY